MVQLKRIIFLIHPNCYLARSPDGKDEKFRIYWDRERKVEREWKRGIDTLGKDEFFVIFSTNAGDPGHPAGVLAKYAREKVGLRFLALTTAGRWDDPSFKAWTDTLKLALRERGFTFDPMTIIGEGWGESFDGCVAGYSAYLSGALQFAAPVEVMFELTVPDMPFLLSARLAGRMRLQEKQLRLFLFEDVRSRPIGLFMPEVCVDGMKAYLLAVKADPSRLQVYTKQGKRLEPSPASGSLVRRIEDGIEISLHRDAPNPFFGGQLEGPLFFVGPGMPLQEMREIMSRVQIREI